MTLWQHVDSNRLSQPTPAVVLANMASTTTNAAVAAAAGGRGRCFAVVPGTSAVTARVAPSVSAVMLLPLLLVVVVILRSSERLYVCWMAEKSDAECTGRLGSTRNLQDNHRPYHVTLWHSCRDHSDGSQYVRVYACARWKHRHCAGLCLLWAALADLILVGGVSDLCTKGVHSNLITGTGADWGVIAQVCIHEKAPKTSRNETPASHFCKYRLS